MEPLDEPTPFQRHIALQAEIERTRVARYRATHRDAIRARDRAYNASHQAGRKAWKKAHAAEYRSRAREATFDRALTAPFVAFDGEGSYGRYQLLAASATDDVIRQERSLGTLDCLAYFAFLYLRGDIGRDDAVVGFGLSYDFENILRDLSDEQYSDLRLGKLVRFGPYDLKYVHRKFLDVAFRCDGRGYRYRLQDIYPYFQQSFVKACESRGIELPEIIYEGKRSRSAFRWRDIDKITRYNRAELTAMAGLATTLRSEFVSAFQSVDLTPVINRRSWYGPGAQAASVLAAGETDQLRVVSTRLSERVLDTFSQSYGSLLAIERKRGNDRNGRGHRAYLACVEHPFAAAYFGGRIEASMRGKIAGPLYDYDLSSAYPHAITLLPNLAGKTFERIDHGNIDNRERIGFYLVRWRDEDRRAFHPLPYRSRGGNVYFPPSGFGWVLSPELHAAIENGADCSVLAGYVIRDTGGYGRGLCAGNDRSSLALLVERLADERIRAKQAGDPAHRALKLLANSVYGKTLQKEGSRRYFNAFVAAWITSVTRARIYRAIANTKPGEVVSVMTDGILSTVPLDIELSSALGGWELTMYESGYQFAPGVYELTRQNGTKLAHYRGFLRFDPTKAAAALDAGNKYVAANPVFVSRTMAMHDRKLRKKMYQFAPLTREEEFSLASKRDMSSGVQIGDAIYYPAKTTLENDLYVSWPYDVYGPAALDDDEGEAMG